MELRRDSPARRKRLLPTGTVVALAPLTKRTCSEERLESPFDAVLAAANMAGERAPVRIAPNATVPPPKPALPLRKRPTKGVSTNAENGSSPGATPAKGDKGLRHFSTRVCAKVEEKGATTYNEVADELVQEIGKEVGKCDHKNIRRRVYDALNVLMAIDVIRKDKKEIRWLGLPNETATEMRQLEETIAAAEKRVQEKRKTMSELVQRLAALKNLIRRNADCDDHTVDIPPPTVLSTASLHAPPSDKLQLPFILINAPRDCRVHCEMLEDRSQYFFEFDSPFLINEDIELLRLMCMEQVTEEELHEWLPAEAIRFMRETEPFVLEEWDDVEGFLESMPPAIGGLAALDVSQPLLALSSPVRKSSSRPLRPFRSSNVRTLNK
ncbi:Transcription factor E2F/dimerization partner (TDP) domain-containing protein [Paramicrosporidium saccamoebae]|uniref:Transcription factor E2F/dimerization partner (TDP) domain-containing protein n=1 Tax=Paramicrosporidium saccamoebae TaxID=1246581 RepID=A0A2H9TKR9_9FUNG|nr:Transcription factor E2F/dimerization partner (TDP) domain-containing protein [Paramicrosporidium saccamoebae]